MGAAGRAGRQVDAALVRGGRQRGGQEAPAAGDGKCVWGYFLFLFFLFWGGGGGISFALLTTDHKNRKGSKDEIGGLLPLQERAGEEWEMGGILGVVFGLVLLRGAGD